MMFIIVGHMIYYNSGLKWASAIITYDLVDREPCGPKTNIPKRLGKRWVQVIINQKAHLASISNCLLSSESHYRFLSYNNWKGCNIVQGEGESS